MEDKFIGLAPKKNGRKELMNGLEAQRKDKAQQKATEKASIKIQSLFRCFLEVRKMKKLIQSRMQKRLNDLVQVKIKMKDDQFVLPLQIANDFLRDFNYLIRYHYKPKNKYCDKNSSTFNWNLIILEKLSEWIKKGFETKKTKDNLLFSFYSSQLQQSAARRQLKNDQIKKLLMAKQTLLQVDRCYVNLVSFLNNVFFFFSAGAQTTWKDNLQGTIEQFFNLENIERAIAAKGQDNLRQTLLFQDELFINYDIYQLFSFQITQMIVRNSPPKSVETMIEAVMFPIKSYYKFSQKKISNPNSKEEKDNEFNKYIKFQSEFITKIVSIPRVASFVIAVERKISLTIPYLNWKNLFQSFLFSNIEDPLSASGEREFIQKNSSNQTKIINLFANSIRILKSIVDGPTDEGSKPDQQSLISEEQKSKEIEQSASRLREHYFFLKLMSYCLNMLTPDWFSAVLTNYSIVDREVIAVGESLNIIFERNFSIKLCSAAFEQDFFSHQEERKIGDRFNPEIGNIICEIYSKILATASKSEESQKLTFKILSAFAYSNALIARLLSHINTFFGKIDCLTEGNLCQEQYNSCIHVYTILVVSLYNQFSITDYSDFFSGKCSLTPQQLPKIIVSLIQLNYKILSHSSPPQSSIYFSFQSSKLLKLLREFDRKKPLMADKDWVLNQQQIKSIMLQVQNYDFSSLSIVRAMPFCLPFEKRFEILSLQIACQKHKNDVAFKIIIRRNNIFGDGFEAFRQIRQVDLQAKLRVYYVDEFGNEERGIDAGGIFKEFINDLSKIVFDPNYGMFCLTENNQKLHPNQDSQLFLGEEHLEIFHFLGSVVGRAIYDHIIIGPIFSIYFLRKIVGKLNNLVELENFDKELYKNLKFLKEYTGDPAELSLTFSIVDNNKKEISLIPNGKNISVTHSNLLKYVYLVADYKMNKCIQDQSKAFLNGLTKVIPQHWLQMFDENEVQMLISGEEKGIDIQDLKQNTIYDGGYTSWDFYIRDFWRVVSSFTEEEKVLLLKFVTSYERQPLLGFKNMQPNFTISKISSENDTKLPHSSTCFNKLNLPKYSSEEILRKKLILAIKSGQGFYLS